ncbi:unnamed protein product, partial [Rangifer tarandus platyrhynchus]
MTLPSQPILTWPYVVEELIYYHWLPVTKIIGSSGAACVDCQCPPVSAGRTAVGP